MRLASASEKVFHKSHMEEIIKHSLSSKKIKYILMLKIITIYQIGTFLILQLTVQREYISMAALLLFSLKMARTLPNVRLLIRMFV